MTTFSVLFANLIDNWRVYLIIQEGDVIQAISLSDSAIKLNHSISAEDLRKAKTVDTISPEDYAIRIMTHSLDAGIPIFATCRRTLEYCIKTKGKRIPIMRKI